MILTNKGRAGDKVWRRRPIWCTLLLLLLLLFVRLLYILHGRVEINLDLPESSRVSGGPLTGLHTSTEFFFKKKKVWASWTGSQGAYYI